MGWLSRLFGGDSPPAQAPGATVATRAPAGVPMPAAPRALGSAAGATETSKLGHGAQGNGLPATTASTPNLDPSLAHAWLNWLLQASVSPMQPLSLEEQQLCAKLDEVLAAGDIPDKLLPRANAYVPQLMGLLRQADVNLHEVAERIAQDAPLAAEVLRVATSAAYAPAGSEPMQDLMQAVQRVGLGGVQRAVARLVYRPMYANTSTSASSFGARLAPRLWQQSERVSELAAMQARDAGLAPFDGYIAGLLHATGWTIVFRVLDLSGIALKLPLSEPGALALEKRAHRLFGLAARRWQITPGFQALAEDAQQQPLARSGLPLAASLRFALVEFVLEEQAAAEGGAH
jgi:hypothetical protein